MTKPELARDALGLELWRLLVREHEAPEQPVVQREFQKRWAYPKPVGTPLRSGPDSRNGRSGGASW
eukprot:6790535-Alexandrium_andersonii.AAC.1